MTIIRTLSITLLFLAFSACTISGGGDTGEFNINPDNIQEGELGEGNSANTGGPAVNYDPIFVKEMLDDFLLSSREDRELISDDLAAIGKQVLPHISRVMQRNLENDVRIALLRLQDRITNQNTNSTSEAPAEVEDPNKEEGKETGENGSNEGELEGNQPPSLTEDIVAPTDLNDLGFDQEAVDAFILNRMTTASNAFQEKNFERTIELCKAILTLAPQTRYRKQVLQLMLDAETGELTDRHLAGTIAFDRRFARFSADDDGTLDKALELTLFLTNVGTLPITIDLGEGGEGNESILVLSIELNEDSATDFLSTTGRITLPLVGKPVRLEAGQSHKFSIDLKDLSGISAGGGQKRLVSRVSALGSLRPAKMFVHRDDDSKQRVFRPILLSRDEVVVMPKDFDIALAERAPAEFVRKNIETLDIAALQMAFVFVTPNDQREVLNILLADNLRQASTQERQARLALAARLTGREYNVKVEDWLEWWRDNRFRY